MFQVPGRRADSLRIGRYTNFLDTTNRQHWMLSKQKNGFTVKLVGANEYLNVRLATARDGANIQTWSNGGTIETLFTFEMR